MSTEGGNGERIEPRRVDQDFLAPLDSLMKDHWSHQRPACSCSRLGTYEHHNLLRHQFHSMRMSLFAEQFGTTRLSRLHRMWMAYWWKPRLISTIQAAEYMLMRCHSTASIHELLRSEICVVKDFARQKEVKYLHANDLASMNAADTTKIKLLNILTCMLFVAFPPWLVEELVLGQHGSVGQAVTPATLLALVRHPVPEEVLDQGLLGERLDGLVEAAQQLPEAHGEVRTTWLDAAAPLADAGREYAFLIGLKHGPGGLGNKQVYAIEAIVVTYFRALVSRLLAALKVKLDTASHWENNALGAMISLFLLLPKVAMGMLPKVAMALFWPESGNSSQRALRRGLLPIPF